MSTLNATICREFINCIGTNGIIDYRIYVPSLIGNQFGMTNSDYRTNSIAIQVVASAGCYFILWTKCFGESRNYDDQIRPFFTKWSWTKICANLGPAALIAQMWITIPYSVFNYPSNEYFNYIDGLNPDGMCRNTNEPFKHWLSSLNTTRTTFIDTCNKPLRALPSWLGCSAIFFSTFMGLQIAVSCLENKRIRKRDALMIAMQIANLIYGILQVALAKQIDFGKCLNADDNACYARFVPSLPT